MSTQIPPQSNVTPKKKGTFREYAEALLTAILIALVIRAFVIEAFKIPSGSMLPTLSIGDHIFVNKFIYGLRIPFTKYRILDVSEPKRGDVVVFIYPSEEKKDFIKRIVGIPGDNVRMEGEGIWVNGHKLPETELNVTEFPGDKRRLVVKNGSMKSIPFVRGWRDYSFYEEDLDGVEHLVQYEKYLEREKFEAVVPKGQYLMIGDNRDNSSDSREWGFVPRENIKGKAMFVWLPLDKDHGGIRWHEFGRWIR